MQKHQQLQQALHDIISPNDFKMRPISLELIIAAVEVKNTRNLGVVRDWSVF